MTDLVGKGVNRDVLNRSLSTYDVGSSESLLCVSATRSHGKPRVVPILRNCYRHLAEERCQKQKYEGQKLRPLRAVGVGFYGGLEAPMKSLKHAVSLWMMSCCADVIEANEFRQTLEQVSFKLRTSISSNGL